VNRKARLISIVVTLAVLGSLLALLPVFAETGSVSLDKNFIKTPGGVLTVTLTDSDLEVGQDQPAEAINSLTKMNYDVGVGKAGETFYVRTQKFPILDRGGLVSNTTPDGVVNHLDVIPSTTQISTLSVDTAGGLITFVRNVVTEGGAFTLAYTAADLQTADVTISSTQDAPGFSLRLQETGSATGVFEGTFNTVTTNSATTVSGSVSEAAIGVDLNGDGDTTDTFTIDKVLTSATTTEGSIVDAFGNTLFAGVDIDGDGYATTTIPAGGPYSEVSANLDLDGDGVISTTLLTQILDFSKVADETIARIDIDGDGVTNDTGDIRGVDLNNDGDATDSPGSTGTSVTAIDVAGIPGSSIRPSISAVPGSIISASYTDASPAGTRVAAATVETTKPSVTIVSPAHELSTRTQATRLIAEVTDSDSGVDEGTIAFNIILPTTPVGIGAPIATAITGGFRVEAVLTGVALGETEIIWNVTASDNAGNVGQSDQDSSTEASDDHSLRVDTVAPGYASPIAAETGHYYDDGLKDSAATTKNTSIRVIFNEKLDGASIQSTDFTVDGVAPVAAEWFSKVPTSVFLTVPAMASNAKPKVKVVNTIGDSAGNTVSTLGEETAVDGISPVLAVDVSPTLDKASVIIDISSDEALLTAPTVTINGTSVGLTPAGLIATNLFRTTATPADQTNAYNVEVSITDTSANVRTAGKPFATSTDAILFELDNAIPDATILVDNVAPGTVDTSKPFIEVDWTAEGTEYDLAGADVDSHNEVVLISMTLDGVDVLSQVNKEATAKYLLATSNLALGEHELKVKGEDDAGNSKEMTAKFTVAAKAAFSIPLNPGWNLISMPGPAVDPAIDTVITPAHPISTVLTYDPTAPGGWLIAQRGDDGLFAGSLSTISETRAYWVQTSSFEALKVDIVGVQGGAAALPPAINLVKGWNLLPVLDVSGVGVAPAIAATPVSLTSGITADDYVTIDFNRIYSYNPRTGQFSVVTGSGVLGFGRGYWVFMTAAGTLVP
jgi:hypothetical protein